MSGDEIGEAVVACGAAAWLLGIPIAFGFMLAKGLGVVSIFLAPFWPVVGLAWFGFWVAA